MKATLNKPVSGPKVFNQLDSISYLPLEKSHTIQMEEPARYEHLTMLKTGS